VNGFFKKTDEHIESLCHMQLYLELFWSRRYEYPFALKFAEKDDVVLDAACGTYHPLKLALSDICKTYACDIADAEVNDRIIFTKCDIAAMPYQEAMFDKVFCISSLEHMNLTTIQAAVSEFRRVLKPGGKLIVTIDYPTLEPKLLLSMLNEAGFDTGESDFDRENAVISAYYGNLLCYHIFAVKKDI
jgi:ubiquinone/menaquinone biosynthesis C-methylase UbiE